jgi:hypothetical protein
MFPIDCRAICVILCAPKRVTHVQACHHPRSHRTNQVRGEAKRQCVMLRFALRVAASVVSPVAGVARSPVIEHIIANTRRVVPRHRRGVDCRGLSITCRRALSKMGETSREERQSYVSNATIAARPESSLADITGLNPTGTRAHQRLTIERFWYQSFPASRMA